MLKSKKQLKEFVKVRNESSFQNNMQFAIDAEECGFRINELGEAKKIENENGTVTYVWNTPFGQLIEEMGKLRLED